MNYSTNCLKAVLLVFVLLQSFTLLLAQPELRTSRATGLYEAGENMTFLVDPISSGEISYKIFYDEKTEPIQEGTVFASNSSSDVAISFTLDEPGVVFCEVEQFNQKDKVVAVFSPYEITQTEPEPADFDEFWDGLKSELAAVPMSTNIFQIEETDFTTTYQISLQQIDNRRVYGYLSVPKGAGPFPGVLELPAFGDNALAVEDVIAERAGALHMKIVIHNAPANQTDPNAYEPDIIDNRDENYFRWAVLSGLRSLDYLTSRDDWDGENLAVTGVSQGGALSTMVSGLDDRVTLMSIAHPSHHEHTGNAYQVASGWPFYLQQSIDRGFSYDGTLQATRYYDAINFAKRYKGKVLEFISYEDEISLASGIFAGFNHYRNEKILMHWLDNGHNPNPSEYWNGRFDFWRRHIPSTLSPPWPYPGTDQGYTINAGDDIQTDNNSVNLSGSVADNETVNPDWEIKWSKIEGPGSVNFGNDDQYNTSASFSAEGTYILQMMVTDDRLLDSEQKYWTLFDYITVTVGESSGGPTNLSINCPGNSTINLSAGATGGIATWSIPNATTTCGGNASVTQISGVSRNSFVGPGSYTITYRATDNCGNTENCSFIVRIIPSDISPFEELSITCQEDIQFNIPENSISGFVSWDVPVVQSNCTEGFILFQLSGIPNNSNQSPGEYTVRYRAFDQCGNVEECDFMVTITRGDEITPPPPPPSGGDYCEAEGDLPWEFWIRRVRIGSINHSSIKEGYGDFTDESTTLQSGENYTIRLTTGYSWASSNSFWKVWIDQNANGVFENSEAVVTQLQTGPENGTEEATMIANFNLPGSITEGSTRMRVAMSSDGYQDACGDFTTGEVEDYSVVLESNGNPPAELNVNCLNDFTVTAESGENGLSVGWSAPTATTTCSGDNVEILQNAGPAPGSFISVGTTTISYMIGDNCGNIEACTFTITVLPNNTSPPNNGTFCTAQGDNPWNYYIERVRISSINNWSGKEGYADFTDEQGFITAGDDKYILLTPGNNSEACFWTVYIDFNQDRDFFDAGEEVVRIAGIGEQGASFDISGSALNGDTRMRVVMQRGTYASPCGALDQGEVEDYTMTVNGGSNNTTSLAIGSDYLQLSVDSEEPGISNLQWVSNQDQQATAYQIERAGIDGEFQVIETIIVDDPSAYAIVREYEDSNPQPGINTYRVIQLRSDNTEQTSNSEQFELNIFQQIFPNPTEDGVYFKGPENLTSEILLDIYTIDGKHLRQELLESGNGLRYLDLSVYESGLLLLKFKTTGKTWTERVLLRK